MPARQKMPSTLKRSPKSAQETWAKARDSAEQTYGEGRRASQTAYSALKHTHEKVGDHWEPKPKGRKGPSDAQAKGGRGQPARKTAGGVDANASKTHLMEVAKKLDITGRSRMSKGELVKAIQKANNRQTARARSSR
jgi:hypothetical protein